jgi:hypothetical protein
LGRGVPLAEIGRSPHAVNPAPALSDCQKVEG